MTVQAKIEKALVKRSRSARQYQYSQGWMAPQSILYILLDYLNQKEKENFICKLNNKKKTTTKQQEWVEVCEI